VVINPTVNKDTMQRCETGLKSETRGS